MHRYRRTYEKRKQRMLTNKKLTTNALINHKRIFDSPVTI